MSLQQLLRNRKIQQHQTSRNELDELRALVDRDLKDAVITQLSADRRFAVAYNAVLQLAKMVLACEGYRASSKSGHHATTLEAAGMIAHRYGSGGTRSYDFANCRTPGWHLIMSMAAYHATDDPFFLNAAHIPERRSYSGGESAGKTDR